MKYAFAGKKKNSKGKEIRFFKPKTEGKQHECNDVCLSSMGDSCRCSCGGVNHGTKAIVKA